MTRRQLVTALVVLAAAVLFTVWPVRSRHLFSWDSANYAFAADRIDIAAHRPHPPGYLGYVFAARGLRVVTRDINTALVSWNVLILRHQWRRIASKLGLRLVVDRIDQACLANDRVGQSS